MTWGGRRTGSGRKRKYEVDPIENVKMLSRYFERQPVDRKDPDYRAVLALRLRGADEREIGLVLGLSSQEVLAKYSEELELGTVLALMTSIDRLFAAADEGSVQARIYLIDRMRAGMRQDELASR